MENPFINVENLVKIYKKGKSEAALESISFRIRDYFNVIVGPSGSGKSTLLNCIGGLIRPSAGKILVNNKLISHSTENELIEYRRKTVGFIFQDFNLIEGVSVEENIKLPGYISKLPSDKMNKRFEELLSILNLNGMNDINVELLSGGEKQRVGIAAALINDPKLILADEPTGQLDRENTKIIVELLKKISTDGKYVIIATHDPFVVKYANTIMKLTRNKIEEVSFKDAFSVD